MLGQLINVAMFRAFKLLLRFVIRNVCLLISAIIPARSWRSKVRECGDHCIIRLFCLDIESFIAAYPKVYSEEETLEQLIQERKSITRFGDGEFKLIIGERHKSFQDLNEDLNARMLEVLRSEDPDVLVAIHPVRDFDGLGRIWQKFIIRIGDQVLDLLDRRRTYHSTGVFHLLPENDEMAFRARVRSIKRLWEKRKVLIVVGKGSRFRFEPELFDNVASVDYVYGPAKNAYLEYDSLIGEVRKWDKNEYLILLVLGPTATVMAYDLGREGYQAIDFGQMPGKFRKLRDRYYGAEAIVF